MWRAIYLGLRLAWYRSVALWGLVPTALGIHLNYQGHSPHAMLCLGCGLVVMAGGMALSARGVKGGHYVGGGRLFRLGQMIVLVALAMLYAQWRMGDSFSLSRVVLEMTGGNGREQTSLSARLYHHTEGHGISPEVQRLMGAIALGYLPRGEEGSDEQALRRNFVRSGGAHILVVSGFHLGVVVALGAFVLSVLRRFRWGRAIYFVWLLLLVWGFVVLTGGSPPTIRAAMMLTFVLIGRWLFCPIYLPNILAVSALVQLLTEPTLLYSAGMWLSYMAVLSIGLYAGPLVESAGRFRSRALRYLWQVWAVSISVQVYVLPLCLYLFGAVSWSFVWTSLPMALVSTLLIPLALIIYMLEGLGLALVPLNTLAEWLGQGLLEVAQFGSRLSPLWVEWRLPLWALVVLWALASVYPLYQTGRRYTELMGR